MCIRDRSVSAGLSVAQNFDLLGGTFYVDTQLDYMRNFGDTKSTQFSSIPFRIGYQQELLGFNAFRWDRKIEPLKFEKVKKQYLYNAESVSEEAVSYFFTLAMAQADYELARDNVATTDTLYAVGEQRQKIAAISQADLLTLKLDSINELRRESMPLLEAIHTAGHRRLRAIIMTTLTTVFAMVPLLFTSDLGSEMQRPLSVAMIGTMMVGLVISLFVIPLIYWFIYRKHEVKKI